MRVTDSLTSLERSTPTILTMGAFDGVHRGHQSLIRQVVNRARRLGCDSLVITFDPRPEVVLRPGKKQLSDAGQKQRIIAGLGVNTLVMMPFTAQVAEIPAGQFLLTILEHVNLAEFWVGADFAFGHKREGNVNFLIRGINSGMYAVHVVPRRGLDDQPLSSTTVREAIERGDVAVAATLLGHYFHLSGPVVRGEGRGEGMGFPTANLAISAHQLLPATGIYAAFADVMGSRYGAAVSVGWNPQFDGRSLTVEAFLLDFDGDLRDCTIGLDFVARLRDERRFEDVDALTSAMAQDVEQTRAILSTASEPE